MLILSSFTVLSIVLAVILIFGGHTVRSKADRRLFAPLGTTMVAILAATSLLLGSGVAQAAIVPTIPMGTADDYSVLAGTTVTNTGATVLNQSLGLSPGTDITGFPPGIVNPPGVVEQTTPAAAAAQLDLTAAYLDAAARPLNETVTSDLTGLTLVGGVYAGPSKSPLSLAGNLTLDGAGDPNSVFIFQTDSTLITGSGSTVTLINGAQQCNVFWQVGSSATLGTGSTFVGTILALTSITVTSGVTVQGRALARNGAVTLDNDTFNIPTCDLSTPTTTTTTPSATTTTAASGATTAPELPFTGSDSTPAVIVAILAVVAGIAMVRTGRTARR
ncbi:MAG: ice-binding family protein [Acidimicrobiia bacterium]